MPSPVQQTFVRRENGTSTRNGCKEASIRSNWSLEMLIFEERGKPENPEKNLPEQSKEPTTNLTHSGPEPGPRRWQASEITTTPSLIPNICLGGGGYGYAHAYGESSTMELVLVVSTLFLPVFIKFYPFQVNSMVNL